MKDGWAEIELIEGLDEGEVDPKERLTVAYGALRRLEGRQITLKSVRDFLDDKCNGVLTFEEFVHFFNNLVDEFDLEHDSHLREGRYYDLEAIYIQLHKEQKRSEFGDFINELIEDVEHQRKHLMKNYVNIIAAARAIATPEQYPLIDKFERELYGGEL